MGETGPQIAILVFYVVPHLSSMVSSTIPAWDASVNDFGVVQDDRREPARIEGHRPGPLGILSDQDSLLATTARFQWRAATGSPSKGRVSFILVHFPEQRPPELVAPLGLEASLRAGQACQKPYGES